MVPKHVQREDFFEEMYDMLRRRPEVTELTAVPDAFTPVIKMKFSDIPVRSKSLALELQHHVQTVQINHQSSNRATFRFTFLLSDRFHVRAPWTLNHTRLS